MDWLLGSTGGVSSWVSEPIRASQSARTQEKPSVCVEERIGSSRKRYLLCPTLLLNNFVYLPCLSFVVDPSSTDLHLVFLLHADFAREAFRDIEKLYLQYQLPVEFNCHRERLQ